MMQVVDHGEKCACSDAELVDIMPDLRIQCNGYCDPCVRVNSRKEKTFTFVCDMYNTTKPWESRRYHEFVEKMKLLSYITLKIDWVPIRSHRKTGRRVIFFVHSAVSRREAKRVLIEMRNDINSRFHKSRLYNDVFKVLVAAVMKSIRH